jgi:hypothetical protein
MVIFAQKRLETGKILSVPVRIRNAQKHFEREAIFDASQIVSSQAKWGPESVKAHPTDKSVAYLINYTNILSESEWRKIEENCTPIIQSAKIMTGAIVGKPEEQKKSLVAKNVPWLTGVKESMPRPFYIQYTGETILYPDGLQWPRSKNESVLNSPKVLLAADPNPSWGQRAKVAIERRGYYVSSSFWAFAPKPDTISLEVLAAVLSWDVSNVWIVENLRYPWIRKQTIENIPVPYLTSDQCKKLEIAIRQIETAAEHDTDAPEAQQVLDSILKIAYRLDEQVFQRLRMVKEWDRKSKEVNRPIPENPKEMLPVHGMVETIDTEQQTISLWFDGLQGNFTLPITDEMPGWMLRHGAAFSAEVSYQALRDGNWENIHWWNIRPKEYTYLGEDELIAKISSALSVKE